MLRQMPKGLSLRHRSRRNRFDLAKRPEPEHPNWDVLRQYEVEQSGVVPRLAIPSHTAPMFLGRATDLARTTATPSSVRTTAMAIPDWVWCRVNVPAW